MKKGLSIFMALLLLLATAVPAFGGETDSAALEKTINQVKSMITVPDSLTEFSYSSSARDNAVQSWQLVWTDKENSSRLNVAIADGVISEYYYYEGDRDEKGLGSVTKEQGKIAAEAFLKKVLAKEFSNYKLTEAASDGGDQIVYAYDYYKDGILVDNAVLGLSVSKYTGKVVSYQNTAAEFLHKASFLAGKTDIGMDKAKELYQKELGLQLTYFTDYDWETEKATVFAAFAPKNKEKFINASTGETLTRYVDYRLYGAKGAAAEAERGVADGAGGLTPQEKAGVDLLSTLISKEEAVKVATGRIPGLDSSTKPINSSLAEKYIDKGHYEWRLYFEGVSAVIDASTKEVLDFNLYEDLSNVTKGGISKEKAQGIAETYIKTAAPEKSQEVVLKPITDTEQSGQYNFSFLRHVNGIPYADNSISVSVNKIDGKIVQYENQWYDTVKFQDISKAQTSGKAFEAASKDSGFDKKYIRTGSEEFVLAYGFTKQVDYLLDSVSCEKLNYNGEKYVEDGTSQYKDVSGKWYEAAVNALLDNGYYLKGDTFNGGNSITQETFLRYLYSPNQRYSPSTDDFYDMMMNNGIIEEGEIGAAVEVTRQDAAKFLIRYLGQDMTAEHSEIFKDVFKDKVDAQYKGYAAVAKGLGIMQGDSKGRFNGTAKLTNAQAAVVIYNTLNVK